MRVCAQPQCPELLETGRWCDTHQPKRRDPKRVSPRKKGYDWRWQQFSVRYRRANPECVRCGAPSEHVDHIDGEGPLGPRGYDEANLQALCKSCHSYKTAIADGSFGRARLPR